MEHNVGALLTQLLLGQVKAICCKQAVWLFFKVGAVLVRTITIYSGMVPVVCLVLDTAET